MRICIICIMYLHFISIKPISSSISIRYIFVIFSFNILPIYIDCFIFINYEYCHLIVI